MLIQRMNKVLSRGRERTLGTRLNKAALALTDVTVNSILKEWKREYPGNDVAFERNEKSNRSNAFKDIDCFIGKGNAKQRFSNKIIQ